MHGDTLAHMYVCVCARVRNRSHLGPIHLVVWQRHARVLSCAVVASRRWAEVLDAVWFSSLPVSEKRLVARVVGYVACLATPLADSVSGAWLDVAHECLHISNRKLILDVIGGGKKVATSEAKGKLPAFGENVCRLSHRRRGAAGGPAPQDRLPQPAEATGAAAPQEHPLEAGGGAADDADAEDAETATQAEEPSSAVGPAADADGAGPPLQEESAGQRAPCQALWWASGKHSTALRDVLDVPEAAEWCGTEAAVAAERTSAAPRRAAALRWTIWRAAPVSSPRCWMPPAPRPPSPRRSRSRRAGRAALLWLRPPVPTAEAALQTEPPRSQEVAPPATVQPRLELPAKAPAVPAIAAIAAGAGLPTA